MLVAILICLSISIVDGCTCVPYTAACTARFVC